LYAVFHVVELLSLGHHRDTRQKGQIEEQHCFWVCHKFQNLDEEQRQAPLETRHSFSCPELLTGTNLVMIQWHMQMITLFPPKEEHSDQLPQNSPSNHKGAI
jgi:hypothetical protein